MKQLSVYAQIIENRLNELLPEIKEDTYTIGEMPALLANSMRYSLLANGKRLRPSMMLAFADMMGVPRKAVLDYACAAEMIHNYSLIHDDLPGMDNDSMRRGRPTNHIVFGEGQAILAGDGLLNYAFETMLNAAVRTPEIAFRALKATYEIAQGAGVSGIIGGQTVDLYSETTEEHTNEMLEYIQHSKTACMFIYPLRAAAWLCGATEAEMQAITAYGEAFGMLFQATDDLLDVIGDEESVGKTLGKDEQSGKLTCISQYGIAGTRMLVQEQHDKAVEALSCFEGRSGFFKQLVDEMVDRVY